MNLWLIFLAIAVIAMVVGPIMMLQPNSSQRIEESLRARARELGLRVGIMSLPRQATDIDQPAAMPMYCLPHPHPEVAVTGEWMLLRAAYDHPAHFEANWQWHGAGRASKKEQDLLKLLLPQLPPSVAALAMGPRGYCCYWSERGGLKTLEFLATLLSNFSAQASVGGAEFDLRGKGAS